MILRPVRLEPVFSPRPWGALSLAPYFPEKSNLTEPIGEAWMTGNDCRFADGPFAGRKLAEAWSTMPSEWTGSNFGHNAPFPILVKFIFTEQKLSVQVHPDDDYASRHEAQAGGRGKTEMWYALHAGPDAEVMAGLQPGATKDQFRRGIEDGTAEKFLTRIPLNSGEAIFVPAGTVHTIGPGLVLCEIQEYSDLTYRVYDYNRRDAHGKPRDLHVEKAFDVIRLGEQLGGKIDPVVVKRGALTQTFFATCRYFATAKWEFSEHITATTSSEHFDLLVVLEGRGKIQWAQQAAEYGPMQVWLLPAALGEYVLAPQNATSMLQTFVPKSLDAFERKLSEAGVAQDARSRIVHR